MEPSLPTARGLAIAGEWIAGGVGTHETALASPDRVDVGGRCVVPGFTDSHVHFPTWAMAQHEVRLAGTRSLEEALARLREAREESCWHFRDAYIETTDDEYVEAMRTAIKLANSRGVTAVHDKDGWLGAPRFWQRLDSEGALTLRVWQSLPAEKVDDLAALGIASGFGGPRLELGYLKVFMDGTLGSQTARMLDGSGVEITSREAFADLIRRAA